MDQSSESQNSSSGCGESESRVKREVVECAAVKYNPCEEMSLQHVSEVEEFHQQTIQFNSNTQNNKPEHLSEQSEDSLDVSNDEMSNDEEFTDLLQTWSYRSDCDVIQPTGGNATTSEGFNALFIPVM